MEPVDLKGYNLDFGAVIVGTLTTPATLTRDVILGVLTASNLTVQSASVETYVNNGLLPLTFYRVFSTEQTFPAEAPILGNTVYPQFLVWYYDGTTPAAFSVNFRHLCGYVDTFAASTSGLPGARWANLDYDGSTMYDVDNDDFVHAVQTIDPREATFAFSNSHPFRFAVQTSTVTAAIYSGDQPPTALARFVFGGIAIPI